MQRVHCLEVRCNWEETLTLSVRNDNYQLQLHQVLRFFFLDWSFISQLPGILNLSFRARTVNVLQDQHFLLLRVISTCFSQLQLHFGHD